MTGEYVKVARVGELPAGGMMRVEAHGTRILLVNVDGELFAICDTCSHEEASLYQGALHGDLIRCPLHGSRFNVRTGEPLEEPADEPVAVFPVKVEGEEVFVGPALIVA